MSVKAVLSDLGRVILHFDNHIFYRKLAGHASLSYEEIARLAFDHGELVRLFDGGRMEPRAFYGRVTARTGAAIGYDAFFAIYNDIFSPIPGTLDVLGGLKAAGLRLVLVSNTDPMRFGFIKRRFPEILIFNDYVLSYEVGAIKPDRAIYEEAIRKAGCRPDEAVFVDDIAENVAAAGALGIKGIVFKAGETDLAAALRALGVE
ncbi:MAG: HAD family phosphatase [Candidatus Aminicenantes bacterium]|nr:HAD family phosphatase [Candidatus Aminicenantes bacterium]